MTYCCNNVFIHTFFFFMLTIIVTKYKYISGFNPKNSSIATPAVSSFVLSVTNLFELLWYFDLMELLVSVNKGLEFCHTFLNVIVMEFAH